MKGWNKILYVVCIGTFIEGIRNLVFVTETPISLSILLFCIPLLLMYLLHTKACHHVIFSGKINIKNISLGLLIILFDLIYNLYTGGIIGILDCGLIISGLFIIVINTPAFFERLGDETVSFATFFVFSFTVVYLLIFTLPIRLFNTNVNPLFVPITKLTTQVVVFLLNLIKPTAIAEEVVGFPDGLVSSIIIDFDGFRIGMGDPCSGVVSMVVFLVAVFAYYIALNEKTKNILIYTFIGTFALFWVNILRVCMIILVGYYFGNNVMLFMHENLGWVFFTIVMAIFWYFVLKE